MHTLSRSAMKFHLLPALLSLGPAGSDLFGSFNGPSFDGNIQPPDKDSWDSKAKCRIGTRSQLSLTAIEKRKKLKKIAKKSKKRNRCT